ncbi:MAG: DUF302 domain-containing protein [Firmicutes bacterium]|nr:DUF302 domain-containing protein [Bacillota bacterium]
MAETRLEPTYRVETERDFDEAVRRVEEETAAAGFRVLHVHDVAATLAEKGFASEPYKIVEICNARYASRVLGEDPEVGALLPCKVNVYRRQGRTYLSALLPSAMAAFYPGPAVAEVAREVEQAVRAIVDRAR